MKLFKQGLGLLVMISLFGMLLSCYYDKEDQLYPAVSTVSCDTSSVTYTAPIKTFLDSRCAISGCHQTAQQSPDLSSFATASAAASTIYGAASNANHASRFTWSACEKKQLQLWCANPLN